jgi:hypothetical protein
VCEREIERSPSLADVFEKREFDLLCVCREVAGDAWQDAWLARVVSENLP